MFLQCPGPWKEKNFGVKTAAEKLYYCKTQETIRREEGGGRKRGKGGSPITCKNVKWKVRIKKTNDKRNICMVIRTFPL